MLRKFRARTGVACIATIVATQVAFGGPATAEDKLLTETVEFAGTLAFLGTKVPGFVLVAVRNGEMAFAGFGNIADKNSKKPDADSMFRIGSISKVFCGELLASLVLDGKVRFSDRLQDKLGYDVTPPEKAGRPGDEARLMQGHNFDGSQMPAAHTPVSIECAGGLHSTANDIARWMKWHLDAGSAKDRDLRLLDHAAYLYRDGLSAVVGLDDGGPMDAMGLGWVINMPAANHPLILQKSGGLQGNFAYLAIAPTRGVAAFFVMNEFSTGGFTAAVAATNALVAELAPR
jgi:CubicO group peptidase (beta-lactamase class C family)